MQRGVLMFFAPPSSAVLVATIIEDYYRLTLLQPENCEWVISIETINANGRVLPPGIILKCKIYNQASLMTFQVIGASKYAPNEWTTDELGLQWLQQHFIPATNSHTQGIYRLLIPDGDDSHLTPQFEQICSQHDIIPFSIPAHLSHLLPPFDVCCSASLKTRL
jgi:hypothetical protein